VKEIHQHIANSQNGRLKSESSSSGFFPNGRNLQSGPVRKPSFSNGFSGHTPMFPGMDPIKQEYSPMETDAFLAPPNGNVFMDTSESFGLDAPFTRLAPSNSTTNGISDPRDLTSSKLGTSLFETFDPAEIEAYLKAVRGSETFPAKPDERLKDGNCAVCLQGEQTFQPIQLYCDCCFTRIKRGGMYYKSVPDVKMTICVCQKCFSAKKNGKLTVGQMTIPHQNFQLCKNDERVTETWVACDKCGYWVHASCGLFNRGENNDDAKYMCPFCLKDEMERGRRTKPDVKPISMWGADELSECALSDFIQTKVNAQVISELHKLGLQDGACHPLTVRVLMTIKKVTKVQPNMVSSFPELPENYPYYQKVIGVFQKIHKVDVLLFCMYVQEYSDDCPQPNKRWVNLEYIDSVKHFTPDIKTVTGEALRSVVYQEALLAYIEFVKRCGFEVFYIWACPPGKEGEDYILHCKPKNQRIPSADRLRLWYKDLLGAAKERKIVTHDSNLMDTFFTNGIDRAVGRSFSAEEMPYFEGDYWPGEAEKILKALRSNKGSDYCRKPGEKRKTRGEMSLNESLENGLMVSLPFPRWSDFMVWHLQEPCSLCQTYITSGNKYVYHFDNSNNNKSAEPVKKRVHFEGIKLGRQGGSHCNTQFFQICETCYQTCAAIGEGGPIPDCVSFADLEREEVLPVTSEVGDFNHSEESKFSEIFESRQAFLAFCKGNHYQFDTLQHAKHSTMMLLYHLHNTNAPVFPVICWGCGMEMSPSFTENKDSQRPELCQTCQAKGTFGGVPGVSPVMSYSADRQAKVQKMTESFEHAAYCNAACCTQPDCRRMKDYFAHVQACKIGAAGGCKACRIFVLLVKRHAHFCNRPCFVPDCKRLKAVARQQMRLDQAQRSRVYYGETSGSSSSS